MDFPGGWLDLLNEFVTAVPLALESESLTLGLMKFLVPLLFGVLFAPVVSAGDFTDFVDAQSRAWTIRHNYNGWHVPLPGYEGRVIKTRKG